MILLLDNYDSFTFNLQHCLLQLNAECLVKRNDECSAGEILEMNLEAIVLSPGPGRPLGAGVMDELIAKSFDKIPILGICLGHQAIGEFFGAQLVHAKNIMHGKTSELIFENHFLFQNIQQPFEVMRYHSLILEGIEKTTLKIIARTKENEPMAIIHPEKKIFGVQFHPESILTPQGMQLIKNWWKWIKE